jgi:16S rRNA processing protein RimM
MIMDATQQWVWLARIRKAQGRKGEVFADILTDFPEKFAERRQLWLVRDPESAPASAARAVELIAHWPHKGGIVLHFAGIDSISAAETLTGLGVAIPLADRAQLGADEAYISDLIGCTVIDVASTDPVTVGVIEDVDTAAGPTPLLVVRGEHAEILIPYAKSYLRQLDLETRRLLMDLPEGLVDLN